MHHELMGRAHAAMYTSMLRAREAVARDGGQGTVEYVGLILLIAVVLAGVVKASEGFSDEKSIAETVVNKLKDAINDVGGAPASGK